MGGKGSGRKLKVSQQAFIDAWRAAKNLKDVCETLGIAKGYASGRACGLRKTGVTLKKLHQPGPGRPRKPKPVGTLRFDMRDPKVAEAIWDAQAALNRVGIWFDTGAMLNVDEGEPKWRDWELDCSLRGPVQVVIDGKVVWDGRDGRED